MCRRGPVPTRRGLPEEDRRGSVGGLEDGPRPQADDEDADEQHARRGVDDGREPPARIAVGGLDHVHLADDLQVVVERDGAHDDRDGGEPEEALLGGRLEQHELRHEAGQQRHPAQREQRRRDHEREVRLRLRQAAEVLDLLGPRAVVEGDHRDEHGEVGDQVSAEVQQQRRTRRFRHRRDGHQHEADLADRGVGEQPLDVRLLDGDQVPHDHRRHGQRREHPLPVRLRGLQRGAEQREHERERRRLRGRRDVGGDGQRGALVRVRRPHVERYGRGLETEAGDEEREAEQEGRSANHTALERRGDGVVGRRAGGAVDEAQAVEQHRRGDAAEQHVLQPSLAGPRVVLGERDADVQREREQLDGDVGGEEFAGGGHVDGADRRDEQQGVELALVRDVAVHELIGAEHDRDQRRDEQDAEERRVVVDGDELREVGRLAVEEQQAGDSGDERAEDGDGRQQVAGDSQVAAERVEHQHGGGGPDEDELGEQQSVLEVQVAHDSTSGIPSSRPIAMRSIHGAGQRPSAKIEIESTVAPARSAQVISPTPLQRGSTSPKKVRANMRSRYVAVIAAVNTASPPTMG